MVMFFSGGTIAFDGFSIVFTTSRPMVYNDQRPHPPSKINGQKMGGKSAITGGEANVIKYLHVFNISQETLAQRIR